MALRVLAPTDASHRSRRDRRSQPRDHVAGDPDRIHRGIAPNGGGDGFLWSSIAELSLSSPDIVADYSTVQGDVLHFTNMDADDTVAGNQDFTFIGTAAFTAPGQINWFSNGTDTFIQLNTDADLAADGMIQLSGMVSGDSVLMFL